MTDIERSRLRDLMLRVSTLDADETRELNELCLKDVNDSGILDDFFRESDEYKAIKARYGG